MIETSMLGAIDSLVPPLLAALDQVGVAQRYLHPPFAKRLASDLEPYKARVLEPLAALERSDCPAEFAFVRDRLVLVGRQAVDLIEAFVQAARSSDDLLDLYRAVRRFAPLQEALYPLCSALEPVSRWFLEPAQRDDQGLIERLRVGALREGDDGPVGVFHSKNERDARGGFSLYIPESWDGQAAMPLVVALHGGNGHGRDFLWTWLRDVRSRAALLIAPTSRYCTWSIMGRDDVDAEHLKTMVETVAARFPVDRGRVLLTGMSDGATYALLCGLRDERLFSHLAPVCGVLHPFLLADGSLTRALDRPIYLVHGTLDWMFPLHTARFNREMLEAAGARLVYREIEDLSHTYPRDENPRILDWLMSA